MHIGDNIKQARERLGLSRKELACLLKLRVKTVKMIEQKWNLSDKGVHRIAEALGVPPEQISDGYYR